MDWQGLTIEREIHPLTLEEGTAEIDHYQQEIHGNQIPAKLPMGLHESPAAFMEHRNRLRRSSSHEGGLPHDRNNSASTRQMYDSHHRRRHQHAHGRSPGGDPDPSDSEWETASTVSGMSSAGRRQREGRNL